MSSIDLDVYYFFAEVVLRLSVPTYVRVGFVCVMQCVWAIAV